MKINAAQFDQIARDVFAPIYPVIAEQIVQKTGITAGKCLDVGCGGGYLGLALAKITDLQVYLLDQLSEMLEIVDRNIAADGMADRAKTLFGDVQGIPLPDQSIDLAVSRGSIFFWADRPRAFKEIYRVLAPGGVAYIGGGFGTVELKTQIIETMMKKNKDSPHQEDFRKKIATNIGEQNAAAFEEEMRRTGIPGFEISRNDAGLWIIMTGN